jgi:hypothetical protein
MNRAAMHLPRLFFINILAMLEPGEARQVYFTSNSRKTTASLCDSSRAA